MASASVTAARVGVSATAEGVEADLGEHLGQSAPGEVVDVLGHVVVTPTGADQFGPDTFHVVGGDYENASGLQELAHRERRALLGSGMCSMVRSMVAKSTLSGGRST